MDYFESDEMNRVVFYRYFSSKASETIKNIASAVSPIPNIQPQQKVVNPIQEKQPQQQQQQQQQKIAKKLEKPIPVNKEPKKVPVALSSNNQQQQQNEIELPLDEGIKLKKDPKTLEQYKTYDPAFVEKYWYNWWLEKKYFHCKTDLAINQTYEKKFVMVVPPPNVTGYLHIGHALTASIEDCLTRWHRMKGNMACWLPGVDHAGIATQSVVEKQIWKENQLTKRDLGREKFLEKVWEWKNKYGNGINQQFHKLGASLDWDRFVFTMDPKMNKYQYLCFQYVPQQDKLFLIIRAVTECFVRLFERKLIYRANRLVNWSCKLKTALSDIEVEYDDIVEPKYLEIPGHKGKYEFGVLIKFAYKVKGSNEEIIVATTRIETMLGDTAVAVNSNDPKYQHLIGKELEHPFIKNRVMKIITDDELVDMNFGTGAVKVTPGHDFRDYECGKRNKLEFVNIFNDDGSINKNGGPYEGMMRFDCRNKIIKDLENLGLFRGKDKNPMRLGFCSRSGDVIEPLLRPQWYVSCKDISLKMIDVVKNKELQIIPEAFETTWYQWLENIQDWCISRQIWWGHRCPVYLAWVKGTPKPSEENENDWIAARSLEEAYNKAAHKLGVDKSQIELLQDEDVLDTWFSSALFPFSSFNWPDEENPDYKAFYPGHLLETGHDILFFWVARMVMMGLLLIGKLPFKQIYLHQIIRDEDGEKMSKSKGNVIDPLDIIQGAPLEKLVKRLEESTLSKADIEKNVKRRKDKFPEGIPPCGTDSLRFGLLAYTIQSRYINLDVDKIVCQRLFCNKIWNTFKFATSKFPEDFKYDIDNIKFNELNLLDRWILTRLNECIVNMNKTFHEFKFGETTIHFHNFWLYELCDVYLEGIKPAFYKQGHNPYQTQLTLFTCIEQGLRLLHPIMPFITEELYQKLPIFKDKSESICIAKYPEAVQKWGEHSQLIQAQFEFIMNIVKTIRSMVAGANLKPSDKPDAYLVFIGDNEDVLSNKNLCKNEIEFINTLAKTEKIEILNNKSEVPQGSTQDVANNFVEVYVNIKKFIKFDEEIIRLQKKIDNNNALIEALQKKMSVKDYDTKVPANVKKLNKEKMDSYIQENQKLTEALNSIKKML